ncbi:hypothetical protein N7454_002871 [Penicillium verhagenii]|nr:hypothetical protein N7454_002871 [Penicillium verhagenii]
MTFAYDYDYIIIGAGLAGTVLASTLHTKLPTTSILILEAGEDRYAHPFTTEPLKTPQTHHSDLDWNLTTVPQPHLSNRTCYQAAGKALGGSTAMQNGTWMRGPKVDYDRWATLVGDARWSWNALQPYFPKTETRSFEGGGGGARFSFSAPTPRTVVTATPGQSHPDRVYGLRGAVLEGWVKGGGVGIVGDADAGFPVGVSERVESWDRGRRQMVHRVFGLDGVQVLTKSRVARIVVQRDEGGSAMMFATGVELVGGERGSRRRRSPKILMLSGIGPGEKLRGAGVQQSVESPYVGRNFHDHLSVPIAWKLKEEKQGMNRSLKEMMNDPVLKLGWPSDWIVFAGLERSVVKASIEKDGGHLNNPSSQLL